MGGCANLSNDVNNCGLCGISCGANQECLNGQCACSSGYTPAKGRASTPQTTAATAGAAACRAPRACGASTARARDPVRTAEQVFGAMTGRPVGCPRKTAGRGA
jgi:hypothetical protein